MSHELQPSSRTVSLRYSPQGQARRRDMLPFLQRSMRRRRQRRIGAAWAAGIGAPSLVAALGFAMLQGRGPGPAGTNPGVVAREQATQPRGTATMVAAMHLTIVPAGAGAGSARALSDDELLQTLAQTGRDCGLIRIEGRAIVTDNRDGRRIGEPDSEPGARAAPAEDSSRAI
jgi:hypothetical protein